MQRCITIKLKTGEDLIAIMDEEFDNRVIVHNPIEIRVDPHHGFYAKSWLLLAEKNSVSISKEDILFLDDANMKAIHHYEEFIDQTKTHATPFNEVEEYNDHDELEEMFTAMIESKNSKMH